MHDTWLIIEAALPGFDLKRVRNLIGDNPALYLDMLRQFHSEFGENEIEIVYSLGIDQEDTAEKILHKLKGVSGNLGAVALNQACEALDAQLKQRHYGEAEYDHWIRTLNQTRDLIQRVLKQFPEQQHTQPAPTEKGRLFKTLEEILLKDAYVSQDLLDALQSHITPPEQKLFDILSGHISMLDYPKARSTLKTLSYVK